MTRPRPRWRWNADKFLQAFRETCCVVAAAKSVGIGRHAAYDRRRVDPDFAKAWDEVDFAIDHVDLPTNLRRRAVHGTLKPIVKVARTWKEHDPNLNNGKGADVTCTEYKTVGYETVLETGLSIWYTENKLPLEFMRKLRQEQAENKGMDDEPAGSVDEFL